MTTIKNLSDFVAAYEKATSRVSVAPKPLSEFELMPMFPFVDVLPSIPKPNSSKLRPMLVMELVHAMVHGYGSAIKPIFDHYSNLLDSVYGDNGDKYSQHSNLPGGLTLSYIDVRDADYFSPRNETSLKNAWNTLNDYLLYSYAMNGDIFADETYEVLGPYPTRGRTGLIRRFHVPWAKGGYVDFIITGRGPIDIDMFGHTDLNLVEQRLSILVDGDFLEEAPQVPPYYKPELTPQYMFRIHQQRLGVNKVYADDATQEDISPYYDCNPQSLITFIKNNYHE